MLPEWLEVKLIAVSMWRFNQMEARFHWRTLGTSYQEGINRFVVIQWCHKAFAVVCLIYGLGLGLNVRRFKMVLLL